MISAGSAQFAMSRSNHARIILAHPFTPRDTSGRQRPVRRINGVSRFLPPETREAAHYQAGCRILRINFGQPTPFAGNKTTVAQQRWIVKRHVEARQNGSVWNASNFVRIHHPSVRSY